MSISLEQAIEREYEQPSGIDTKYAPKRRFGLSAFIKGWQAAESGLSETAYPYRDYRTDHNNGVTFSRAYIRKWRNGWRAYQESKKGSEGE